jgi:hypothetical protein
VVRRIIMALAAASIWLGLCPPSWAWQRDINGRGESKDIGKAVAVDAAGDVIAAGVIATDEVDHFAVIKFAGETGTERWRRVLAGRTDRGGEANAVAVDARGDIVAAGYVRQEAKSWGQFAVVKLSGASGAEVWRRIITGKATEAREEATAVAVDASGSVVVAGTMKSGFLSESIVVKLDGNSGAELWRWTLDCHDGPDMSLALDTAGGVLAAGRGCPTGGPDSSGAFTIIKLDGASGVERWRYAVDIHDGGGMAFKIAADAGRGVVATGNYWSRQTGGRFIVVKLDGDSGTERWRRTVAEPLGGVGTALAVDAAGNVVAAGTSEIAPGIQTPIGVVPDSTKPPMATVVKLDGSTGAELWRRPFVGTERSRKGPGTMTGLFDNRVAEINGVNIDARNDVLVGGCTLNGRRGLDFTVIKLDGRSGNERWRRIISGRARAGGDWDAAAQVVTDAVGNVVAVGKTFAGGLASHPLRVNYDFTVVKLRGPDGQLYGKGKAEGATR